MYEIDLINNTKAVCYLLVACPMLTVLNLTKSGPWETGSIIKNIGKIYHINKDISILYRIAKCFEGANLFVFLFYNSSALDVNTSSAT